MIPDPHRQRQAKSGFHSITAVDGRTFFIDEDGVILGRERWSAPRNPPSEADIADVVRWIQARGITCRKSPSVFSYSLKHAAERWIGRHVSNGAAIVALDRCGFSQVIDGKNTWAGIALRSYRSLPEVSGWQFSEVMQ